ncbi:MAG: glycosyltransferase [Ruminococcaceae bacterium]|nr:glycosyltransferase [Oscillospiraceae bacterium]
MVSVVIPVYNEEKRIEKTAEILDSYLKTLSEDYQIVFSNDGSVDSTFEKAKKLSESNSHIKTIGYTENKGKGSAVRHGMLAADGDIILFTDCDLAYGTEVIGKALEKFEETGADIVTGSRNLNAESYEGYTFLRKIMSKVYFKLISTAAGFKLSDSQCGFKCFRKKAAHDIFSECVIDSFAFDLEALMKAQNKGYTIAEMPVKILQNDNGESKVRVVRDTFKMLGDIRKIKKANKKTKNKKD